MVSNLNDVLMTNISSNVVYLTYRDQYQPIQIFDNRSELFLIHPVIQTHLLSLS